MNTQEITTHLQQVAVICSRHPNALLELGNENYHPTQNPGLPAIVHGFHGVPGLIYAEGASADDESAEYAGGSYITVHYDRADGDNHWRWVRHHREGEVLSATTGKFVVSDEAIGAAETFIPGKRDNDPDKFMAFGILCRMLNMGSTFHYEGGLQSEIPTGKQLECFSAWMSGTTLIPDHFRGSFRNSNVNGGWDQSPVQSHNVDTCVRAYSSVDTHDHIGYTLLLGVTGNPAVKFGAGWQAAEILRHQEFTLFQVG